MTHAHDTAADRCSRCDAHDGAPDTQSMLAELRAQLEEARRERDTMRAAADAAGVRIAVLRAELSEARRERDEQLESQRALTRAAAQRAEQAEAACAAGAAGAEDASGEGLLVREALTTEER